MVGDRARSRRTHLEEGHLDKHVRLLRRAVVVKLRVDREVGHLCRARRERGEIAARSAGGRREVGREVGRELDRSRGEGEGEGAARARTMAKMITLERMITAVTHTVVRGPGATWSVCTSTLTSVIKEVETSDTRRTRLVVLRFCFLIAPRPCCRFCQMMSDGSHARDTSSFDLRGHTQPERVRSRSGATLLVHRVRARGSACVER